MHHRKGIDGHGCRIGMLARDFISGGCNSCMYGIFILDYSSQQLILRVYFSLVGSSQLPS